MRIIDPDAIRKANLPLTPTEFDDLIKRQCESATALLSNQYLIPQKLTKYTRCFIRWVPECSELFLTYKSLWTHLVPSTANQPTESVEKFFSCVAALMGKHLRQLVLNSIEDFANFIASYEVEMKI